MKQIRNLGILLLAIVLTTAACGQKTKKDDVPEVVVKSLTDAYPHTKKLEWDMEAPNYEANFDNDIDNKEYSVLLSPTGEVLETEVEIAATELPEAVNEYLKTNHPDAKIKETAKITNEHGEEKYEVEIKGEDLIFDGNGQFIEAVKLHSKKKEEKDEEGEEDED